MPNPVRNADGTVQVAPPTMSAFGPASASAPPPPAAAAPAPAAPAQGPSPGFAGALMDLIRSLAGATAPRSIVQRGKAIDQQIDAQSRGDKLGDQF